MTIINLELEAHLSAGQVAKIMDLLSMIKGVARVTSDEAHQMSTMNIPESGRNLVPQNQEFDFNNINPEQKKHIISQAITWGSKHGKITFNELERLNPEEMLSLATRFLSEMTDSEKDVIFKQDIPY